MKGFSSPGAPKQTEIDSLHIIIVYNKLVSPDVRIKSVRLHLDFIEFARSHPLSNITYVQLEYTYSKIVSFHKNLLATQRTNHAKMAMASARAIDGF